MILQYIQTIIIPIHHSSGSISTEDQILLKSTAIGIFTIMNIVWIISLIIYGIRYYKWYRDPKNKKNIFLKEYTKPNRHDIAMLLDILIIFFWVIIILVYGGYKISHLFI